MPKRVLLRFYAWNFLLDPQLQLYRAILTTANRLRWKIQEKTRISSSFHFLVEQLPWILYVCVQIFSPPSIPENFGCCSKQAPKPFARVAFGPDAETCHGDTKKSAGTPWMAQKHSYVVMNYSALPNNAYYIQPRIFAVAKSCFLIAPKKALLPVPQTANVCAYMRIRIRQKKLFESATVCKSFWK